MATLVSRLVAGSPGGLLTSLQRLAQRPAARAALPPRAAFPALHNARATGSQLLAKRGFWQIATSPAEDIAFRRQSAVCALAAEDLSEGFAGSAERQCKLYVGNLPWSVNSETLAETFEQCGKVELVEVIYDRDSGRSRGFAFVTFSEPEEAEAAISAFNGQIVEGRALRVNFPVPPGVRRERERDRGEPRRQESPFKLYVGNLSWSLDNLGLESLFANYGTVIEAKVVTDRETGKSRGFGFVTMSSRGEVNEAIASLDGADIDGRTIKVNQANSKP